MKRRLDEVKRLQKIAGILKENVNEAPEQVGGMTEEEIADTIIAGFSFRDPIPGQPGKLHTVETTAVFNQRNLTPAALMAAAPFLNSRGIQVAHKFDQNGELVFKINWKSRKKTMYFLGTSLDEPVNPGDNPWYSNA